MNARQTTMPIPAFTRLRAYERGWLPGDLVAGLTAAAVVVPQVMAYAAIAGLQLVIGLYTRGVQLGLAALNPEPLRIIQQSALGETPGRERMYFNLGQAVEELQGSVFLRNGKNTD